MNFFRDVTFVKEPGNEIDFFVKVTASRKKVIKSVQLQYFSCSRACSLMK